MTPAQRRTLYLVTAGLAFLALALGVWDVAVERDGGESILWDIVFPTLLLIFALVMVRKASSGDA